MKKTYINPEMQVVNINAPQLLAGSTTIPNGTPGSANNAEVRGFDFDDDDNF